MPFPLVLWFVGVKIHKSELEALEQEPVYTDISPMGEMAGMYALLLSIENGRLGVSAWRDRLEGDSVDDIFRDMN